MTVRLEKPANPPTLYPGRPYFDTSLGSAGS